MPQSLLGRLDHLSICPIVPCCLWHGRNGLRLLATRAMLDWPHGLPWQQRKAHAHDGSSRDAGVTSPSPPAFPLLISFPASCHCFYQVPVLFLSSAIKGGSRVEGSPHHSPCLAVIPQIGLSSQQPLAFAAPSLEPLPEKLVEKRHGRLTPPTRWAKTRNSTLATTTSRPRSQ